AVAAPSARAQLEALSGGRLPAQVYDGSRLRAASADWLPDAKDILARGTRAPDGRPILPFTFNLTDGGRVTAPSAGLEGFLWEDRELARTKGKDAVLGNLDDYFKYLDALLAPVSWSADARQKIRDIEAQNPDPGQRYDRLMQFVSDYTDQLRQAVAASDASRWVRESRIYEVFPRAYNLAGKRAARGAWSAMSQGRFFAEFGDQDLADIKGKGFDTLWVMGIFPIGRRDPYGTAGGSPYAVYDHSAVNPDLGTKSDLRAFVARAHAQGLRVIIDFIPNHTSMDSVELQSHPDWFIHRAAGAGTPPYGYFDFSDPATGRKLWVRHGGYDSYGSKAFWVDTAQLDYSNPGARRGMTAIVSDWVAQTGVDGFRVDMAYQLTNATYRRNWGGELGGPLPQREFLEELITTVKSQHPGTAFIAEGYDSFDQLSADGFDLVYSKDNMDRPGGQTGMYDALASRNSGWIREAIRREAFLEWQQGGMSQMTFIGNHDEQSPEKAFGPWMAGAAFLQLMMPGAHLFYGSEEIGFDASVPQENKPIPFSVPVQVDWAHA
ncbi:MAG: hypothetical protein KGL53_08765, partial [Elusimicrobia bacterium]|nr:hypothetical protein [Elusimicrobiota bacterium]